MEEKQCKECGSIKLVSAYAKLRTGRKGFTHLDVCKKCNQKNATRATMEIKLGSEDPYKGTIDPKWLSRGPISSRTGVSFSGMDSAENGSKY